MFTTLLLALQFINPSTVAKPTGYTHAVKAAGGGFGDVVKMNSYVVGLTPDRLQELRAVRAKHFQENPPASTLIGVQALARPDFLLEVEAVACVK